MLRDCFAARKSGSAGFTFIIASSTSVVVCGLVDGAATVVPQERDGGCGADEQSMATRG
jgi:hypothetical protein